MASILIGYGTGEGQTAKIVNRASGCLVDRGHETTVKNLDELPPDFTIEEFDAVCIGASIHMGQHQPAVNEFVQTHRNDLEQRPTAFFQVSLSSASTDPSSRAEAVGYVDSFLEETGWHPDRIGLFGGALRYSKYGFLKRLMMKQIAKEATGDTDASQDYEYTNWQEVEAFAADFGTFLEGRLGLTRSVENDE
ncbi:flavodoxin domain-containing protein [Haloarcula sp. Atlit-120R]|uniref:flavodoxin domain-containing protein n=1 Tax=Haloarcula sp. Atlit-120R TaxID=2282135 RepID=UPI000EF1C81B|nr:flavodoxin domain-containing protein [Haloarcula sp. Atlit-120R]RLM32969.1 protoporphyrinogen oxidase [Haloarcula sp. Atlit-120R]